LKDEARKMIARKSVENSKDTFFGEASFLQSDYKTVYYAMDSEAKINYHFWDQIINQNIILQGAAASSTDEKYVFIIKGRRHQSSSLKKLSF